MISDLDFKVTILLNVKQLKIVNMAPRSKIAIVDEYLHCMVDHCWMVTCDRHIVLCVLISSLFACIYNVCLLLPTIYW